MVCFLPWKQIEASLSEDVSPVSFGHTDPYRRLGWSWRRFYSDIMWCWEGAGEGSQRIAWLNLSSLKMYSLEYHLNYPFILLRQECIILGKIRALLMVTQGILPMPLTLSYAALPWKQPKLFAFICWSHSSCSVGAFAKWDSSRYKALHLGTYSGPRAPDCSLKVPVSAWLTSLSFLRRSVRLCQTFLSWSF